MYLLQCLTASDASFISTHLADQVQSLDTPFRDSPRAVVKLASGSSAPATEVSIQNFTVTAPVPKGNEVFSGPYHLVEDDSQSPASGVHHVADMLGAGGDEPSHQDIGGPAPGQDSAQTGKVGCGVSMMGIYQHFLSDQAALQV